MVPLKVLESHKSIRDAIEKESLLEEASPRGQRQKFTKSLTWIVIFGLNITLFIFSLANLKASLRISNLRCQSDNWNEQLKKTSSYSPILEDFEFKPINMTFNGIIRDTAPIWRKPPSYEVDQAWNRISMEGFELIVVSGDEISRSGKDPQQAVETPESWNDISEDRKYLAQVEVFHNIHCLDELRKEVWSDYYYHGKELDDDRRTHKAHCIHMLLQTLTCSAEVGIITHNWVRNELWPEEPKTRATADFSINKQCRNFNELLDWTMKRSIKNETIKLQDLKWKEGMEIVPGDGYGPDTHQHRH